MILTPEQAIDVLKAPQHKQEIAAVKRQESQLRVFTEELDLDELGDESYWGQLRATMEARSPDKNDRIFQFARYPLPVTQVCDSILSDFYKVFDGKNRHFNIDGDRDLKLIDAWVNDVNLEKWIETKAREVFKNKPCSFIVIDKDNTGTPYLVFLSSDRLIDAVFKNPKGDLEYIAFRHSVTTDETGKVQICIYGVYDDENYHVIEKRDDNDVYTVLSSTKHNIGYTPAITFIPNPANNKNLFKRRVAFSSALAKLEDWTIFDIFRNYMDHYAPFPVMEAPIKKCPNPDCTNGMIQREELDPREPEAPAKIIRSKCPVCEGEYTKLIGPGSRIGIRVARDKADADGSGVFKMIFPETDKMDYVPNKLDNLELEIRHKTVGLNSLESTSEAMNEMQVQGSFASMETVLLRTKEGLDGLYVWIVTTVANAYYKGISIKVDANFGTEYYLVSEEELQKRFDAAKKAGLPNEELMMIYEQIIDTKYKGNPNKVERQKLLIRLDPMPMYSTSEVIQMADKYLVDPATLSMKINFLNFVSMFEAENAPITQFGKDLDPEKRIEAIKIVLDIYNTELMAKLPPKPVEEVQKPIVKS